LRERIEDIPELAMHFMRISAQRCHKDVTHIDDDVLASFKSYSWPGNVREMENIIERAVVITESSTVTVNELSPEVGRFQPSSEQADYAAVPMREAAYASKSDGTSWRSERDRIEREQMVRALAAAAGNKAEAARALGIARSTLVSKLKKLGLT
jgi:DNA-binding NtrC family response regulator